MAEALSQDSQNTGLVLRTEGLVKTYGKRTVVNHVSFDVKQGEIVGLLGPNGAGKTTSFYMTTGLVVPNEGRRFRRRFGFCGRISARDFKTVLVFHGIYRHVFLHSAAECACSQAESPRTCFALHYAYCGFQFV